jgi:branched-chain amino acid transport system substrate-binding protein
LIRGGPPGSFCVLERDVQISVQSVSRCPENAATRHPQMSARADYAFDAQTSIKQAQEFGLMGGGSKTRIVGLDIFTSDIQSIGLAAAQGVIGVADFYWDMDDTTRAWSKRFKAVHGKIPTYYQADGYSAVCNYLAAVKTAGTTDPDKVSAIMYQTPLSDSLHDGVKVRKDGRVMQPIYLMQVKTPQESKGPDDIMEVVSKIPPEEASFRWTRRAARERSNRIVNPLLITLSGDRPRVEADTREVNSNLSQRGARHLDRHLLWSSDT